MTSTSFLNDFFQSPNQIKQEDVRGSSPTTHPAVTEAVRALEEDETPVVLPRETENGTVWYGIATTEKQAQRLAEEVRAFIGPSYSTYRGGRADLDGADPIESLVETFTQGRALRFTGDDPSIREALHRMLQVRKRRIPRSKSDDLGVGLLLRRFEMALRAGDRGAAELHIQALRKRQLLEPENLTALTVRMLVTFEAWEEILERDEIQDLLQTSTRPLAVTQALLRAVYHVHVAPHEDNPEQALNAFETEVKGEFTPLLAVRSSMRAPEVLKAFMLKAVSGPDVDVALRDDVLRTAASQNVEDPALKAFAALGEEAAREEPTTAPVTDPMEAAQEAMWDGRLDQAFRSLQGAAPSPRKVRALSYLYPKLQSIDVEQEIAATLQALSDTERKEIIAEDGTLQTIYDTGGAPSTWTAWFERVKNNEYSTPHQAVTFAKRLAERWSAHQLAKTSGALDNLIDAVTAAPTSGQAGQTVSRTLPFLLKAFQEDPEYPRDRFQELYRAIHARIPYTEDLIDNDLDVYLDLSEMLLRYGVSADMYREIVGEEVPAIWSYVQSPQYVNWLLDVAELLRLTPQHDTGVVLRLLSQIAGAVTRFQKDVEPAQVQLLEDLCSELGHPEAAPDIEWETGREEAERDVIQQFLSERTLGIYTLTESAGRRVEEFLAERCPSATIHCSNDKHGSSRLHTIARESDYFLVVTRSASHAATGVIEQHVPTDRLICPRGKGSSSMIRDLSIFARDRSTV